MEPLHPAVPARKAVRWPLIAVVTLGLGLFTAGLLTRPGLGTVTYVGASAVALLILGGWVAAVKLKNYWLPPLTALFERHTDDLDGLPERRIGVWIALASGTAL